MAGGDWLMRVDRVAYRWKEFKGDGWHFGENSETKDRDYFDPLYTGRQMRMAFRLGVAWGERGTPENIAAADREHSSWLLELAEHREVYCPDGGLHNDEALSGPDYYWRCKKCGHHSITPF